MELSSKCLQLSACEHHHHRHGVGKIDMGNEMGNNSTSGLKEEDNTNAIDSKNLLQEAADADDVQEANQTVPIPEAKGEDEEVTRLASDDPTGAKDTHTEKETLGGREQKDSEVYSPTGSPKALMEPIGASGEDSKFMPASCEKDKEYREKAIESDLEENLLVTSNDQLQKQASRNQEQEENETQQPAESLRTVVKSIEASGEDSELKPASSPYYSKVHERTTESNLEENLWGASDHQLEKQASIREGGTANSTFNAISPPHDSEPREFPDLKSSQHELEKVNANLSEEDSRDLLQGIQDFVESSLEGALEENLSNNPGDNPNVEKEIANSMAKEAPSEEGKMPDKGKIEKTNRENARFGLGELTTRKSDAPENSPIKCNGEFSTVVNSIRNDSLNPQVETDLLDKPLNSHQEVSEPEDKCVVLTEDTKIAGSGSETEENRHEYNATQFFEELAEESKIDGANGSRSNLSKIASENEEYQQRNVADVSSNFRHTKDCPIEEAKLAENACQVDVLSLNQNKASDAGRKDSEQELLVVSENGAVPVPAELIVTDHRWEEERAEEKEIVEEFEKKAETSHATVNDTDGSETAKRVTIQPFLVEHAKAFLSLSSSSIIQSQVHNRITTMAPQTIRSTYELSAELKQESCDDFFVASSSSFGSTTTAATKSCVRNVEGEVSVYANGRTEARESLGRLSTESNPDNMNTHVPLRKSPSFDLELRSEERGDDSDQAPLLFQDKATMESSSSKAEFTLGNSVADLLYNRHLLPSQSMTVEEKVITLERSDSEKSRIPFLGFLKEEEEAKMAVIPQKQENSAAAKKATRELCNSSTKEAVATPHEGREKRKPKTSFFGICMCCATVMN